MRPEFLRGDPLCDEWSPRNVDPVCDQAAPARVAGPGRGGPGLAGEVGLVLLGRVRGEKMDCVAPEEGAECMRVGGVWGFREEQAVRPVAAVAIQEHVQVYE